MSRALIDFDCALFTSGPEENAFARDIRPMFDALRAFGLEVVGSAPTPNESIYCGAPVVRLIVEEVAGFNVLPAECTEGPRLVKPRFSLETHGHQRIVRLDAVEIVGKPNLIVAA
jgi:hypothetical protein